MARGDRTEGINQPSMAANGESQKQSGSTEPDVKAKSPESENETQFFDGTISKIKEIDGEEVVVMSDHLLPGEKLKRALDEEKAAEKLEKQKKARREADSK